MKQEYPVVIVDLKPTSKQDTIQVRVEQLFDREVTTQSSLLSFTMDGHEKFQSNVTKRQAWQNFSTVKLQKIAAHFKFKSLEELKGLELNSVPGIERVKIVVKETIKPNTWLDAEGKQQTQSPKTAGKDGAVLTHKGQPIYRSSFLAINGMDFNDVLLEHDKVDAIAGVSSVVAALLAVPVEGQEVGSPDLPF